MNRILWGLLCCAFSSSLFAQQGGHEINFGLLRNNGTGYVLEEQTTKIPYLTKSDGQIFGVVITPPDEKDYTSYTIMFLPTQPAKLSGHIVALTPEDYKNGLRSPVYVVKGMGTHIMWLDEGDPVGVYKVDVYVNDELRASIEFEILNPSSS